MCQKPWSWQAEVPSAMGQQLAQGLPQAINQHKLTGSRTTVPRAVGNTVLSRKQEARKRAQVELDRVPMKRANSPKAHWGQVRERRG